MKPLIRSLTLLVVFGLLAACNERGDTEESSNPVTVETPNSFLRFLNNQRDIVLSDDWTDAYYYVVDPYLERQTLAGWKAVNGYDNCDDELHIIFRDAKDLGYGRDMYMCKHEPSSQFPAGRFAVFVRNFIVKVESGDPSNYGPINVEAAVEANLTYHVGTNAIEFSPLDPTDASPSAEKVAKFYTFTPAGNLNRSLDLDGRGKKPVPQPCLLCHGSTLLPWDTEAVMASATPWEFPDVQQTLRSAKYNQLELESFDYSTQHPSWSRGNQEERLRRFNNNIVDTYMEMAARDKTNPEHWCADFAIELSMGRYDADGEVDAPANSCDSYASVLYSGLYQEDYVPRGWRQTAERPEGVETLFKRVVEPHCISCHSLRGTAAGKRVTDTTPQRRGNAVNFASYEDFIGYADIIEEYVFRRGVMPLSLRNYLDFWDDPADKPALLASFLPGFDTYTASGAVIEPGRPRAKIGEDRIAVSPLTLDATPSKFASSYQWQLIEGPLGANAVFSSSRDARTLFSTDMDGDYTVRMTIVNMLGVDRQDIVVTIDSSMSPTQNELNFYDDIRPILQQPDPSQTNKREACTNCHNSVIAPTSALYRGIPVYYDDAVDDPFDPTDRSLYRDVLTRVDLVEPENSILLRKPTRDQHGGGVVLDLDVPGHAATRATILNWIRGGALCFVGDRTLRPDEGEINEICPIP
ncbi:MAG: hypothetical protein KBT87_03170 [Gammaproteobacteria bacterium]|jgi:hypothetical protein|nr:hypothetical protein [Gammaproteobacteria bacterium]MBQ0773653.1 hypothetical protein [Gammaproteobacteria bacterium]|tara:strand:+ start:72785 stop:74866 length:2082 start_codon:yes stop_codon:yes gene_type:complete